MAAHRKSRVSKFTKNEINNLASKLQVLLPQVNQRCNSKQSASKILEETCCYIKSLQEQVEQLTEKLSEIIDSVDINEIEKGTYQNLLQ